MREFSLFMKHIVFLLHFVRGVLMSLFFILLVLAVITANVDNMPLSDAIYFTFITALTVGYGDITPSSGATQAISVLAGVVGVIFVGLLVAVSVRALRDAVEETRHPKRTKQTRENDP